MSQDVKMARPLGVSNQPHSIVLPHSRWSAIAASDQFQKLLAAKRRTVTLLLIVPVAFFLAVTVLAGFDRPLMTQKIVGPLGFGYLLIIATYVLCWVSAIIYVNLAGRVFDPQARAIAEELQVEASVR